MRKFVKPKVQVVICCFVSKNKIFPRKGNHFHHGVKFSLMKLPACIGKIHRWINYYCFEQVDQIIPHPERKHSVSAGNDNFHFVRHQQFFLAYKSVMADEFFYTMPKIDFFSVGQFSVKREFIFQNLLLVSRQFSGNQVKIQIERFVENHHVSRFNDSENNENKQQSSKKQQNKKSQYH